MFRLRSYRVAYVGVCAMTGWFSLATSAQAQGDPVKPTPAELAARATAAKASPELVNGLAKELGATPEQAAGLAGMLFTFSQSFISPADFATMSKTVPGMNALLAATPSGVVPPAGSKPSVLTPGIASSAASDPLASMASGFSKLGIKPEMFLKALPFLSGFLKKYGGSAFSSVLETLFKTGKSGK